MAGQPYCPKCGFHVAAGARAEQGSPADPTLDDHDVSERIGASGRPEPRRPTGGPLVLAAVILAAGLIGYGLLTRPAATSDPSAQTTEGSGSFASVAPGASPVRSAPIIGMTIQTPVDGEQAFTKSVTVIGLAPPGTTITRDVSLRPDQHATADSTGHWAIAVDLDQGENTLVFRIGDDRSTEQRIRVTYSPAVS